MLKVNKLFCYIIAGCLSHQVLAISPDSKAELRQQNKEYLKKLGITLLDGEIKVVAANDILKHARDDYYSSKIKTYLAMHDEQVKNGFVNEEEPRAKELLEFRQSARYQYKKFNNEFSPSSTHIRHTISELKMAYNFIGVPESDIDYSIGVAPYGAFKQIKYGDDADGWDGAVQFFEKKDIGTCEYREHNLKLAHGGVELIKELVSSDVSNKPTVILVKGAKETGYLYKISWYDPTYSRELSCASSAFNKPLKQKVIELAQRIDAAQ